MNTYKIHPGADGNQYVRVYFMTFIALDDFLAGKDIYLPESDSCVVGLGEIGEISGDKFGSSKRKVQK